MSNQDNKFSFLANNFTDSKKKKTKEEPLEPKKSGKRSNPNYKLVGVQLPKELHASAKRLLLDKEIDFSELMTNLLEAWVEQEEAK